MLAKIADRSAKPSRPNRCEQWDQNDVFLACHFHFRNDAQRRISSQSPEGQGRYDAILTDIRKAVWSRTTQGIARLARKTGLTKTSNCRGPIALRLGVVFSHHFGERAVLVDKSIAPFQFAANLVANAVTLSMIERPPESPRRQKTCVHSSRFRPGEKLGVDSEAGAFRRIHGQGL